MGGVIINKSEHGRIIHSMTLLAAEVGKAETVHSWEYLKILCVMLPDLELHNLDMASASQLKILSNLTEPTRTYKHGHNIGSHIFPNQR